MVYLKMPSTFLLSYSKECVLLKFLLYDQPSKPKHTTWATKIENKMRRQVLGKALPVLYTLLHSGPQGICDHMQQSILNHVLVNIFML